MHVSKFIDSMGPYVANSDLSLWDFSKSFNDRAYTWNTALPLGSVRSLGQNGGNVLRKILPSRRKDHSC